MTVENNAIDKLVVDERAYLLPAIHASTKVTAVRKKVARFFSSVAELSLKLESLA